MGKQLTTGAIRLEHELEWSTIRATKPGLFMLVGHERVPMRVHATEGSEESGPVVPEQPLPDGEAGAQPAVAAGAAPPLVAEAGKPASVSPATMKETAGRLKGWIAAGLPTDRVLIRVLDLPTEADDELAGMIQLQMDKLSPFPTETMVMSHEVLARREGTTRVLVAATRLDAAGACYQSFADVGLPPACLDSVLLGRLRILKDEQLISSQGRSILVLMEEGDPELVVFDNGNPVLFHTIEGGDATPEELRDHVIGEIGYALMTAEVEYGPAALESGLVIGRGDAALALAGGLGAEFVVKWESRTLESLPPASEGLARRMADRLYNVGCIDLTPAEHRLMDIRRASRRRMAAVALFLVGFWVTVVAGFAGFYFFQSARLKSLEAKRDQLKAPAMEVRALQAQVGLVHKYMSVSNSVLECLRAICEGQPQGVDLTTFNFKKAESIKFTGEAGDSALVYDFKKALDSAGLFAETSLRGPNVETRNKKQVYTFDMELKLPGGETL
jgi:hypothetical protein